MPENPYYRDNRPQPSARPVPPAGQNRRPAQAPRPGQATPRPGQAVRPGGTGSRPTGSRPTGSQPQRPRRKKPFPLMSVVILLIIALALILSVCGIASLTKRNQRRGGNTTPAETTAAPDTTASPAVTTPEETTQPPETEPPVPSVPEITFTADLSAYEAYMNPADRDAYLLLVNNTHTLDSTYVPAELADVVNTRKDGRATQQMQPVAEKALEAMFLELFACGYGQAGPGGYPVSVTSAYRTYAYQESLYNMYVDQEMAANAALTRDEARAIVSTYSALPGTSEHQTGLCCDMHNLAGADQSFAAQPAAQWLAENCWKFGFILRFPDGKGELTQIEYEPWHFRFVGRYHAYQIMSRGLCLEEYLESN